jgi:hypothetical protein
VVISCEREGHVAEEKAFPTSLTPIQMAKRVLDAVRGGVDVEEERERCVVKRETWSIRERTVGWKGFTREASVVAPPEAKL